MEELLTVKPRTQPVTQRMIFSCGVFCAQILTEYVGANQLVQELDLSLESLNRLPCAGVPKGIFLVA